MTLQKVSDLQQFFHCDKTTIYKWMKSGLPSVTIGGSRFFIKEDVEKYIEGRRIIIELITEKQLCEMLKITPVTCWQWRKDKKLPFLKMGKVIRYDKVAVLKWLQEQQEPKEPKE